MWPLTLKKLLIGPWKDCSNDIPYFKYGKDLGG